MRKRHRVKSSIGRPPRLIKDICRRICKDCLEGREPGDRLPPELTLAERYEVSRDTVRSALATLEEQRLVIRKAARGAFVADSWTARRIRYSGRLIGVSLARSAAALGDTFRVQTLVGMDEIAQAWGFNWLFAMRRWDYLHIESPADHFSLPAVLGIVLLEQHPQAVTDFLLSTDKPLVAVDFDAVADGIESFCFDNFRAGSLLARRLGRLGHRRVAAVIESPDKPREAQDHAWKERREGFLDEWAKVEAPPPTLITMERRGITDDLLQRLNELLARPAGTRPTALFVPGQNFLDILRPLAARRRLKIPRDLTLVGCDNIQNANELTAVRFDARLAGTAAAEHLLGLIRDRRRRLLKPTLVRLKGRYVAGKTHARAPKTSARQKR